MLLSEYCDLSYGLSPLYHRLPRGDLWLPRLFFCTINLQRLVSVLVQAWLSAAYPLATQLCDIFWLAVPWIQSLHIESISCWYLHDHCDGKIAESPNSSGTVICDRAFQHPASYFYHSDLCSWFDLYRELTEDESYLARIYSKWPHLLPDLLPWDSRDNRSMEQKCWYQLVYSDIGR